MKPIIALSFQCDEKEESYISQVRYAKFIEEIGGVPLMLFPSTHFSDTERILSLCDGVLIPGGNDIDPALYGQDPHPKADKTHPARDEFELNLVRYCQKNNLAFLGICRGLQIANVTGGGTLCQYIPDMEGKHLEHWRIDEAAQAVHEVTLCKEGKLAHIFGKESLRVNSIHHQTIDKLAQGFKACALSEDGLIEGITDPSCNFFVAVQWHPEFVPHSEFSEELSRAFIEACKKKSARVQEEVQEEV